MIRLRIWDCWFNTLLLVKGATRLAVRTAFQAWVVVWTAVLGAIATFLVMSTLGLTDAPPSAVLEAPRWLEEQIGWISRASEYWCRSQSGCAD